MTPQLQAAADNHLRLATSSKTQRPTVFTTTSSDTLFAHGHYTAAPCYGSLLFVNAIVVPVCEESIHLNNGVTVTSARPTSTCIPLVRAPCTTCDVTALTSATPRRWRKLTVTAVCRRCDVASTTATREYVPIYWVGTWAGGPFDFPGMFQ